MADESLKAAVETMIARITARDAETRQMKLTTNLLAKEAGMDQVYADEMPTSATATTKMRPDEYYGKGFMTAARDYLKRRGHAVSAEEIVQGLEAGSFDFDGLGWKKEGRLRTVATNLSKNATVFHRMPSGLFGLLDWYPEAAERRKIAKKADDGNAGKSEEEGEPVSE